MAFDTPTRNRLQRFVNDARRGLEEEFTRQLQNDYGLDPNSGAVTPLDTLRHLDDAQRETARILRDTLAHYRASENADEKTGLDRIVREQAFTVLNRLAALRMAEARGLMIESVGNGYQAKGFQLYARLAGTGLGETGEAYRVYLFSVFDELAQDLPGLFDRYSPQGRLFPREPALLQALALINDAEIEPLWAEDETIGWIYQYFNSKEERKAMRDASQAPRNSRELAVRNQFFTPRYVVEFLVDNTLGRLWFSAIGGMTGLRDRCRYLLVKPDEAPQATTKLRDPRTLKLLDPACGSMHFGLYAFDLFLEIYREAWAWEQQQGPGSLDVSTNPNAAFKPLCQTYANEVAFLRDVPRLIVERNIYGVDIDPRAAQIASLALWLRAQRAWHDAGIKAKDRPLIGQGHVIAAVAPPAERDLRQQFAASLDKRDAELFERALQMLKGLPELGVLLQVESELPHLVRQAYGGKGSGLFAVEEQENWMLAEKRLREALNGFAQAAQATYQGRLFARDALQGLRLIDLCREVFDVVVMNPPFGSPSSGSKEYVFSQYPDAKYDIFAVFVRRAFALLSKHGFIGAITNRTAFAVESLEQWRRDLFLSEGRLACAIDLGYGILDDAMVEAAAYVLKRDEAQNSFVVMSALDASNKQDSIEKSIRQSEVNGNRFEHAHDVFFDLPGAPIAYFVPRDLIEKIRAIPEIKYRGIETRSGLQTCDDYRFLRLAWEIIGDAESDRRGWVYLSKGGEYQPLIPNLHLLANWARDGAEMKAYAESLYQQWSRTIQSIDFQLKMGITLSERTTSDLSLRILPEGSLFTKTGPGIFSESESQMLALIAVSYSRVFRLCCELYIGSGDESVSGSAARHYRPGLIGRFPMLVTSANERRLADLALTAHAQWLKLSSRWENSPFYCGVGDLKGCQDFSEAVALVVQAQLECLHGLAAVQGSVEAISQEAADLSPKDLMSLDDTIGPSPHTYGDVIEDERLNLELERLWSQDEASLVETAKEVCGARRQLVKLSYFSDRRLELISHICRANPASIAKRLIDRGFVAPNDSTSFAENLCSYLVGVAFGRWSVGDFGQLQDKTSARSPFSSLSATAPCMHHGAQSKSISVLVSRGVHIESLQSRMSKAVESVFGRKPDRIEQEMALALKVESLTEYIDVPSRFFAHHLSRYSESRRQAPIYWPLSIASGRFILWAYYPRLDSQTLYSSVNDYVDPELKEVRADVGALRGKGSGRTRDDERKFESLQSLELELIEFRDTLLRLAPAYRPNLDDGVQINAAPLWRLFRHKPWQKVLKDTWGKLEKGDYDWAHLAMNYWPDRVREKCKTDKSLAIAHGLEDLYVEPEAKLKKSRGRKKAGDAE